ncbi:hypothetical protein C9I98_05730 [Photobacterium sanctipauli]|uniref:DUF4747 domain-containing protein n=1 Tax=Photobacterium sanctipauli TaxID=1342794 RepID=A0A2T3NYW8_9GAMM|nr:DUF6731 family protein [Photobacterium sanctipauli]PSW21432.1 hypothetical protein C9I98_05730 [Photobacterium sanctipauli]
MATKQFHFDFYQCVTNTAQDNALPMDINGVLRRLYEQYQEDPATTVKSIGRALFELRSLEETPYGFKGIIGKHRKNNLPHAAVAGGDERELELEDNENLLEKAHFTFYTENSLLIIQRNRYCVNYKNLAAYLSPANYTTSVDPIIEPADLQWLANDHVHIKTAEIRIARPRNPDIFDGIEHNFNNAIVQTLNGTGSAVLNLSFRGDGRAEAPEDRYLGNAFKRALRETQERFNVEKLDLLTENDVTGEVHPVDLVSGRLTYYDDVEMGGRYPMSADMWEKLEAAKASKEAELLAYFGRPEDRLA